MYHHCLYVSSSDPGGRPLLVHFAKWGNSLALRIPSVYAKEIGARENGTAEVTIEDGRLIVRPVEPTPEFDLDSLVARITPDNRHEEIGTGNAVGNEIG
jgi:antitoxin MazE